MAGDAGVAAVPVVERAACVARAATAAAGACARAAVHNTAVRVDQRLRLQGRDGAEEVAACRGRGRISSGAREITGAVASVALLPFSHPARTYL